MIGVQVIISFPHKYSLHLSNPKTMIEAVSGIDGMSYLTLIEFEFQFFTSPNY